MKKLIVIAGATATGKTDLSIEIANKFGAPIISCDSRQFYREMSIGTAAPTAEQLSAVTHYFVASRSVTEPYTVGMFEQDVLQLLDTLFVDTEYVVMVGGSGLYIDAVCNGLDDIPTVNPEVRAALEKRLTDNGIEDLLAELRERDLAFYESVDRKNPRRVMRGLEVCISTNRPYSELRKGSFKKRLFDIVKVGVTMPRDILYERINRRVDIMVSEGLESEARSLYALRELNALQTVGYREFFDYFDGAISRDQAIELIKRNSRRYAKRQTTWFVKDEAIKWFAKDDIDLIESYIKKIY